MSSPPRRTAAVLLCSALLAVAAPAAAAPAGAAKGPRPAFTLRDDRITESSGLAASTRHRGVYWTVNDSDDGPHVYAVDSSDGRTVARVTLRGITPRDIEAVSTGPDGQIWVGDIGDNLGGTWEEVFLYRFTEPDRLSDRSVDAVRYRVRYRGGPRDAEALMVHPVTGRVHIADKRRDGGALHAGPETLSPDGVNTFTEIADGLDWITDGAFSPDGTRLVLRGYFSADAYRWTGGKPEPLGRLDVPLQRQGESVTFTPDGRALMYGSEGAHSEVWQAPLDGAARPESAARPADGTSPRPSGGGLDGGSPSAAADGGSDGAGGDPAGGGGTAGTGLLAVGVVLVAFLGLRRLRGR